MVRPVGTLLFLVCLFRCHPQSSLLRANNMSCSLSASFCQAIAESVMGDPCPADPGLGAISLQTTEAVELLQSLTRSRVFQMGALVV